MATFNDRRPGEGIKQTPPQELSHWGALEEGDKVVGLNGSIATNVQHHGNYQTQDSTGRADSRKITTFDYNHPTDPQWQGKTYKTPSMAPGPHVYRESKTKARDPREGDPAEWSKRHSDTRRRIKAAGPKFAR
jgi:hypothetical protein